VTQMATPDEAVPLPSITSSLGRSLRLGYKAEPRLLVVAFVTTVAAALPDALFAIGLAWLTNSVVERDTTSIQRSALLLGALSLTAWLFRLASERTSERPADTAAVTIESHVAMIQAEVVTIEHHERPEYVDRLSILRDHAKALSQLYYSLFTTIGALIRLVITLAILVSVSAWLALLAACAFPIVIVAGWRSGVEQKAEEDGRQSTRLAKHLYSLGSTPAPGKEARVAGTQEWLRRRRTAAWEHGFAPLARERWKSAAIEAVTWAIFGFGYVFSIWSVANSANASTVDVVLVIAAGGRLSLYTLEAVGETHFLRTIWLDASQRLAWLEDFAAALHMTSDMATPEAIRHGIRLENVSFRYPGSETEVLKNVTLDLPAGKVVAIVGANGAGKSSVIKLLCRFYDPTEGTITVDGVDLSRMPADEWRAKVAGTFQDFFRFEYTVKQSVGLGDLGRVDDPDAVVSAIERAGLDLDRFNDGLDTQLGASWAGGIEPSFGEWQKIALARGVMREQPLLLLLDEPTAALDAETEQAVYKSYVVAARSAAREATGQVTLVVSHRLSSVAMADLIVVLDGAEVIEQGTHRELMDLDREYAASFKLQAESYKK